MCRAISTFPTVPAHNGGILATLDLSRMHSGKYFHAARERKKGARREKGLCPRARAHVSFKETERLGARASREARSRSIDPHYVVGAPLFTTASDRIWDGERERTARYRTIYIGEPYRSSSSPGNCLAGSQHGVADTLALGIPERRG